MLPPNQPYPSRVHSHVYCIATKYITHDLIATQSSTLCRVPQRHPKISNITEEWNLDDIMDIYASEVGQRQVSSFLSETMCLLSDTAYAQHQSVSNFTSVTYTLNVSVNSENNVICMHGSNMKCLSCEDRNKIWIIDSGASMHFTPDQSDFVMYQPLGDHKIPVSTAASVIHVVGKGSIWIR